MQLTLLLESGRTGQVEGNTCFGFNLIKRERQYTRKSGACGSGMMHIASTGSLPLLMITFKGNAIKVTT